MRSRGPFPRSSKDSPAVVTPRMKTLKQLCEPRDSVFDVSKCDIVLDISDLQESRIKPDEFFVENYLTDGMKRLLELAFLRFERKSQQGIFRLTQSMAAARRTPCFRSVCSRSIRHGGRR